MRYLFIFPLLLLSFSSIAQNKWAELKTTEIPDTISLQVANDYSKYEIIKAAKKVNKEGQLIYRIDIQKKRTLYHLVFNKDGVLKDKSKSKVFEYDGSEKQRKPSSGGGGMPPPRMPSM